MDTNRSRPPAEPVRPVAHVRFDSDNHARLANNRIDIFTFRDTLLGFVIEPSGSVSPKTSPLTEKRWRFEEIRVCVRIDPSLE